MRTLIINDCHLGVRRQGGTTQSSRKALEEWMFEKFVSLLSLKPFDTLIIMGDLFDKRNVEEHIMNQVIDVLAMFNCMIVAGNHDLGGINNHTMSSAEFVANRAGAYWITEPLIYNGFYIVPHMHDQEQFDKAVSKAPDGLRMLVHCNIDSPFARGDHSLNLSMQQIKSLSDRGVKVFAAHEHAQREYHNVTVIGNQFPSSILDCQSGAKRCLYFDHRKPFQEYLSLVTWEPEGDYSTDEDSDAHFISIEGECSLEEYPSIVRRISALRRVSDAFIIRNNVKPQNMDFELGEVTVDQFNIVELFLSQLSEKTRKKVVEKCL